MNKLKLGLGLIAGVYASSLLLVGCFQRRLLYFPSHDASAPMARGAGLTRWEIQGEYTGYARVVENPRRVWLFMHGNGGQAAGRAYALRLFDPSDSVYILEYPGYGDRLGSLGLKSFNQAALRAYEALVEAHGQAKLCVLGESLGSGPASYLGTVKHSPSRIVLVVPFDVLHKVAQEQFPLLPASLIMLDDWDNIAALRQYKGRVDVWGAKYDQVIPVAHARNLAASVPGSRYHEFEGDHGWAGARSVALDD
jgi:pimeloyl-ACP methyl ester carboxylesterase